MHRAIQSVVTVFSIALAAPCLAQPIKTSDFYGINGSLELTGVSRARDDAAKALNLSKESGQWKMMIEKKWQRLNLGASFSQRDIPSSELTAAVQTHVKIDSYAARGEVELRTWKVSWAEGMTLDGRAEVGYAMYDIQMRDAYVTLKDKTTTVRLTIE